MKFSKWLLAAATVLTTQIAPVQGNECSPCVQENTCDLCDINFCDIQYSAYVDALYWKVSKGDLSTTTNDDGDLEYIDPKYQWGYRLGAVAHWKNWDFGTRWTYYTNNSSRSVDGIDFDFHLKYSVLDFELGYNCCMDCGPFAFRPFAGAKLAWIKDRFEEEGEGEFEAKIKNDAVGLYIGSSARWQLCNYSMCDTNIPIALVARASGGVMHSEYSTRYEEDEPDHKKHHIYNFYYDVYLALDFAYCGFCGTDIFFQIGYEAQTWDHVQYYSDDDDTKLGLGGLVLRFGAEF